MANEAIQEGFEVFLSDNDKAFGAVRRKPARAQGDFVIYVENAGEFTVPGQAVAAVHAQKVIVDCGKLDFRLRKAIGHAHDAEDPRI